MKEFVQNFVAKKNVNSSIEFRAYKVIPLYENQGQKNDLAGLLGRYM